MNHFRRQAAWLKRQEANDIANQRPHPRHIANGDEHKFRHTEDSKNCHLTAKEGDNLYEVKDPYSRLKGKPSYLMSFTKGMPHNLDTGLLANPIDYQYFVRAIDSGDPRDFRDTPLGPEGFTGDVRSCDIPNINYWKSKISKDNNVKVRSWESQSAGLSFDLEGPDAQAVTMPPHPPLGSAELIAEMGEVYVQALLRDVPFNAMSASIVKNGRVTTNLGAHLAESNDVKEVQKFAKKLGELDWYDKTACELCLDGPEKERHPRNRKINIGSGTANVNNRKLNAGNAFRGITRGDEIGPYISQFLLIGDTGFAGERTPADGLISYGAININQKVRVATPNKDYMTTWEEWFDVQNGADLRGKETYVKGAKGRRFIHTPRDLATYVHHDALYEAYLNACLILLANEAPFDPGIPFQEDDNRDHQQGFAHFGGPHILSLVTEVATRALKAVRFQKYNVHRRCRPEVLAARLSAESHLKEMAPELSEMKKDLRDILSHVKTHNTAQNKTGKGGHINHPSKNHHLLPMAFAEGSPMHPAYGAGHATVAGACVTILKAFFDCNQLFKADGESADRAYVSIDNGTKLGHVEVFDQTGALAKLTVEGELNKLASNIAIGRNWAGVHYFTDYYESLLMGEQIAIGILEEQKITFSENFSMTLPLFGGGSIRI